MIPIIIDLAPYWAQIQTLAAERNTQKRGYRSSRYWSTDPHFVGLCGEFAISLASGQPVDTALKVMGDAGHDFVLAGYRIDVKAVTYWDDPHLKHPVNASSWPDAFALVAVDQDGQRAKIVGFVSSTQLVADNQIRDYGYGNNYTWSP